MSENGKKDRSTARLYTPAFKRRKCLVISCPNNVVNNPEKTFIILPSVPERREKWFFAAGHEKSSQNPKSVYYICEDHFDLPNDMENYIRIKIMGGPMKMKPHVVPHKNLGPYRHDKTKILKNFHSKQFDIEKKSNETECTIDNQIKEKIIPKQNIEYVEVSSSNEKDFLCETALCKNCNQYFYNTQHLYNHLEKSSACMSTMMNKRYKAIQPKPEFVPIVEENNEQQYVAVENDEERDPFVKKEETVETYEEEKHVLVEKDEEHDSFVKKEETIKTYEEEKHTSIVQTTDEQQSQYFVSFLIVKPCKKVVS